MRILTVNAGSTSWKLVLVEHGRAVGSWTSLDSAMAQSAPDAVAHRVVHGGDRARAANVDDALLGELHGLADLAPLHQPAALDAIARTRARWPQVPHVACFDTAFHATIPEAARTYAIPERFRPTVRVYGFHGLSHAWAVARTTEWDPSARRVVVAHLGGGQSLCAARDGRSVATTMGFTPLDGLVMATRSGAVDPGAVLWMARREPDLDSVLERESGLLALAGTGDMREIQRRAAAGDAAATLAFAVWHHRVVAAIGACVATLGGLDALVFTGGIGEHDPVARHAVTTAFAWLGVASENGSGDTGEDPVHDHTAPGATVRTLVVPAREDLQMAGEAEQLLGGAAPAEQ